MARTVKYTFDPFDLVGVEPKKGSAKLRKKSRNTYVSQFYQTSVGVVPLSQGKSGKS